MIVASWAVRCRWRGHHAAGIVSPPPGRRDIATTMGVRDTVAPDGVLRCHRSFGYCCNADDSVTPVWPAPEQREIRRKHFDDTARGPVSYRYRYMIGGLIGASAYGESEMGVPIVNRPTYRTEEVVQYFTETSVQ